jgi:hypothetical protein
MQCGRVQYWVQFAELVAGSIQGGEHARVSMLRVCSSADRRWLLAGFTSRCPHSGTHVDADGARRLVKTGDAVVSLGLQHHQQRSLSTHARGEYLQLHLLLPWQMIRVLLTIV